MEKTLFRKLQKQISVTLNSIEKEAIDDGEDISNPRFQEAMSGLKKRMLKAKGLSLEDYNKMKKELKAEKDKPEEIELKII